MPDTTPIDGACHCGNIRFAYSWPSSTGQMPVRECGCSFCQKHRGAWTSHPESRLSIAVRDSARLSTYQFGTCTANFLICAVCGITPVVTSEIEGDLYAVVNANTFADTPGITMSRSCTDFEGEGADNRLQRRKRNWIPKVELVSDETAGNS